MIVLIEFFEEVHHEAIMAETTNRGLFYQQLYNTRGQVASFCYGDTENPKGHRRFIALDEELTFVGVAYSEQKQMYLRTIEDEVAKERHLQMGEWELWNLMTYRNAYLLKRNSNRKMKYKRDVIDSNACFGGIHRPSLNSGETEID